MEENFRYNLFEAKKSNGKSVHTIEERIVRTSTEYKEVGYNLFFIFFVTFAPLKEDLYFRKTF